MGISIFCFCSFFVIYLGHRPWGSVITFCFCSFSWFIIPRPYQPRGSLMTFVFAHFRDIPRPSTLEIGHHILFCSCPFFTQSYSSYATVRGHFSAQVFPTNGPTRRFFFFFQSRLKWGNFNLSHLRLSIRSGAWKTKKSQNYPFVLGTVRYIWNFSRGVTNLWNIMRYPAPTPPTAESVGALESEKKWVCYDRGSPFGCNHCIYFCLGRQAS